MKNSIAVALSMSLSCSFSVMARESQSESSKILQELTEQRSVLLHILQLEQQKNVGTGAGKSAPVLEAAEALPEAAAAQRVNGESTESSPRGRRSTPSTFGTVEGHLSFKGGVPADAYVYVQNVKAASVRGSKAQIKQENKQFVPRSLIVQKGTRVEFPNYDAVFHNVFSLTAGNTFDLGTYRAGDAARSVVMNVPGLVKVFCNLHSQMTASILVVPNALFSKVRSDGFFKIPNVPNGKRKIVAWSARAASVTQEAEVASDVAKVEFVLDASDETVHSNKFGQPYGSYKD